MTLDGQFYAYAVAIGFLGYALGATVQAIVSEWFDRGWARYND